MHHVSSAASGVMSDAELAEAILSGRLKLPRR